MEVGKREQPRPPRLLDGKCASFKVGGQCSADGVFPNKKHLLMMRLGWLFRRTLIIWLGWMSPTLHSYCTQISNKKSQNGRLTYLAGVHKFD